jgi:D-tyrosyl-tRNA(Tyr) deacylase
MRVVVQRVSEAKVTVAGETCGQIAAGLLLLVGVEEVDTPQDIDWLVRKISQLRIFNDDAGVMNRSVLDCGGEALAVSQFTLFASTRKGNRPSYSRAARGISPVRCLNSLLPAWSWCWAKRCRPGCLVPICR